MKVIRATSAHDAALRRLLRETPLRGAMTVSLEREPSFFETGVVHQATAVAMDSDRAVVCGSRIVRRVHWNGAIAHAAYLSDLRVHPEFQKSAGQALRDGYRMLADAAHEAPAAVTWSAVFASNQAARETLAHRRRSIPEYVDHGGLHCPLLWCRGNFAKSGCRCATETDRPALAKFLAARLASKPLAPVVDPNSLAMREFVLLDGGGEIVAAMAVHDLRSSKQTRVVQLPWLLRLARYLTRAVPPPGGILALGYAGFVAVTDDDPALLRRLLRGARATASEMGLHFLCLAFHESDPLLAACKDFPAVRMDGRIYQVMLNGTESWTDEVPHIEAGWL
jgi:hypothetical protein